MSQKRKKDRMEQQEMAEEEAADETDIFMKELDDEFEDIEDQLFNQDDDEEKSQPADDIDVSDLEVGEEANLKQNKKLS